MDENVYLEQNVEEDEIKALWVFGYGSLCWKPGFQFHKAVIGHVRGYSRKFWQGNTTHRGTDEKPGRVATLIEDKLSVVSGVAYAVSGEAAVPYLQNRECKLGHYMTKFAVFYPLIGKPINVLLYIATPVNPLWLGDAPASEIASQIVDTKGPSGHNVEYLLRLTEFMRRHFPGEEDDHLFELEKEVLWHIKRNALNVTTLMGDGKDCIQFTKPASTHNLSNSNQSQNHLQEAHERTDSFQYTAKIAGKKLRCLDL